MAVPKTIQTAIKGPRLVDYAIWLIRKNGLNNKTVHERYGVGPMWLSNVETGCVKSPASDTIQMIIEDLTGKALVPPGQ